MINSFFSYLQPENLGRLNKHKMQFKLCTLCNNYLQAFS